MSTHRESIAWTLLTPARSGPDSRIFPTTIAEPRSTVAAQRRSTSVPKRPYLHHADEGEAFWFLGNLVTVKVGGAQTDGRLTVVEFLNPAGFAPPLHRHLRDDEAFYILSGTVRFYCDDEQFDASPGDFVLLPVNLPHSFIVGADEPLRTLQITAPSGFERFAAEVGETAGERRLPDPGPIDPTALGHAAARYTCEILGPPPTG